MANKTNFRSMTRFLRNLIGQRGKILLMLPHALTLVSLTSLMACDPENNPTTMKGRTITPATLPKVQPVRLPKVPESVREQISGPNSRSQPAPATRPTTSSNVLNRKGNPTYDQQTTLTHGPDTGELPHRDGLRNGLRQ